MSYRVANTDELQDIAYRQGTHNRDGYVIYAGQEALAAETFRVCCMGAIEPEALVGFAGRLRVGPHAMRVPA